MNTITQAGQETYLYDPDNNINFLKYIENYSALFSLPPGTKRDNAIVKFINMQIWEVVNTLNDLCEKWYINLSNAHLISHEILSTLAEYKSNAEISKIDLEALMRSLDAMLLFARNFQPKLPKTALDFTQHTVWKNKRVSPKREKKPWFFSRFFKARPKNKIIAKVEKQGIELLIEFQTFFDEMYKNEIWEWKENEESYHRGVKLKKEYLLQRDRELQAERSAIESAKDEAWKKFDAVMTRPQDQKEREIQEMEDDRTTKENDERMTNQQSTEKQIQEYEREKKSSEYDALKKELTKYQSDISKRYRVKPEDDISLLMNFIEQGNISMNITDADPELRKLIKILWSKSSIVDNFEWEIYYPNLNELNNAELDFWKKTQPIFWNKGMKISGNCKIHIALSQWIIKFPEILADGGTLRIYISGIPTLYFQGWETIGRSIFIGATSPKVLAYNQNNIPITIPNIEEMEDEYILRSMNLTSIKNEAIIVPDMFFSSPKTALGQWIWSQKADPIMQGTIKELLEILGKTKK